MQRITITVRFGTAHNAVRTYNIPVTVQTALTDTARQLGFNPAQVDVSIAGVPQQLVSTLRDGDVVVVTTKACGKAGASK